MLEFYIITEKYRKGLQLYNNIRKTFNIEYSYTNKIKNETIITIDNKPIIKIKLIIINNLSQIYGQKFSGYIYIGNELKEKYLQEIKLRSNNVFKSEFF